MSVNGEITAVRISRKSSLSGSMEDILDYEREKFEEERRSRPPSGRQRPKSGRPSSKERSPEQVMRADSDQIDLDKLLHSMLDINDNKSRNILPRREDKRRPFSAHPSPKYDDGQDSIVSDGSFSRPRTRLRPFSAHTEQERANYSFSNSKVDQIDRENQRLLKALMNQQEKNKQPVLMKKAVPFKVQSSATLNRFRQQQQIERENMAFLRRLETVKPTKALARDHLLREHFKQEQFAKNVSKSKRRPASAGMTESSRRSRSVNDLRNIDSESVASSRVSSHRRQRIGSAKRPVSAKTRNVDNRPMWEAGW